ncbi:MAG: hypothetical protein LBI86_05420 [Treponema sp.]|jgi:hypothetical protein|nr:hypothetical protein [Treponema sp.]
MVIERRVEIPADHRLHLDIPPEFPAGKTATVIVLAPGDIQEATPRRLTPSEAIKYCRGLAKRLGCTLTSGDFLEQRRKDRELEEAHYRRLYPPKDNRD